MSAPSSISPESLITVKATYDGNTRRFKLALKEVGPSVFQGKVSSLSLISSNIRSYRCRSLTVSQLRELLAIPQNQEVVFERYSDSAARFVTLDPQNTAVYKQLFRAAKAKLKLRIKITTVNTGTLNLSPL
jgi:next-to-BRCA1 protein 1